MAPGQELVPALRWLAEIWCEKDAVDARRSEWSRLRKAGKNFPQVNEFRCWEGPVAACSGSLQRLTMKEGLDRPILGR